MKTKIVKGILPRISEIAALLLWDLEAIKINLDEPFRLVSGNYSPIYINCRKVISNPTFMNLFSGFSRAVCESKNLAIDVVAGGETAGIPFAAFLAQNLSLPMIYVRKGMKNHGIASLVEGNVPKNARVLLVEDLITDAESKISFINSIQAVGGDIKDVLVLFDRQQGGRETLEVKGIRLHTISDMTTSLAVALDCKLLSKSHVALIREYLKSPREWHSKHGLLFKD